MAFPDSVAVVGASLAGIRTVQALRRRGYEGAITVVGAEAHLPYDRPPLSKDFLLGKLASADLALVDPAALAGLEVDLRLGLPATGLDPHRHEVTVGGERLSYDALVVATGSTPRLLPGIALLPGMHVLRTVEDAQAIRAGLASDARVAIVGGGFIGAEIATAARTLGLDVTLIDPLPALMIRGVGVEVGSVLADRHRDNGVRLRLGTGVARVEGAGRVERLVLSDGSVLPVDLVVVGIGADPALGWLDGSGLDTAGGLRCDATLQAAPGVYGVGDAARFPVGSGRQRLEHWTNAGDQAIALAATLTGSPTTYRPVAYVWSDQLGTRLQIWGHVPPDGESRFLSGGADTEEFVVGCGAGGRLQAVVAFGARREALRAQRLLSTRAAWVSGRGPEGWES